MTEASEPLIVERRGDVEWLTMNRPDRLNALNGPLIAALADRFEALQHDTSVRVVVLRGAGRGFCAGVDIREMAGGLTEGVSVPDAKPAPGMKGSQRLPTIVSSMRRCPQPVIALMHGAACGAGFAISLGADIRIAGESAKMNDAFVTLGVSGCELGMSYFLPRELGFSVAAELMYTGRFLRADRALRLGLVSEVVPDDQLETTAQALVDEMLRVSPPALRKTKETLLAALPMDDLEAVIRLEAKTQVELARGPEFAARISAFAKGPS